MGGEKRKKKKKKKEEEGNSGKGGWPNLQCHNNVCSVEESEGQD